MLDHVDKERVFEFIQKIGLKLKSLFFGCPGEVNFEGVELSIFAAEVDVGLASLAELEVKSIVVNATKDRIAVLWLHGMYYKRIPTFDQVKSFIKEINQDKSNGNRSSPQKLQKLT